MSEERLGPWLEFRQRRLDMGLTYTDLGYILGVDRTNVSKWERGQAKVSSKEAVKVIEDVMNIKVPEYRINLNCAHSVRVKPPIQRGKNRQINQDDIENMVFFAKKNYSIKEIARTINLNPNIVWDALNERNKKIRMENSR